MIKRIAEIFPVYTVGGCVRDEIIGIVPNDIDYVVIASQEEFEKHFTLEKVGNSFPVYLNPICKSEIALTRREISVGYKYQDFECISGVSIEDDLSRRDVTINSIAKCFSTGKLIDPFNGVEDIKNKIMRTINEKAFIEDPLRILRVCRQAVQFNFVIEYSTRKLMKESVENLSHIPPERILLELEKMYNKCQVPSRFFGLLYDIGGLHIYFPELEKALSVPAGPEKYHPEGSTYHHSMNSFDYAKRKGYSFSVAIAALLHDLGKLSTPEKEYPSHIGHECKTEQLDSFLNRHRFDSYTQKLCKTVHINHMKVHNIEKIKKHVKMIRLIRGIRKEFRDDFFKACDCDSPLTQNQLRIISAVRKAIEETEIVLKEGMTDKDAIISYVENVYVKKYKELLNE